MSSKKPRKSSKEEFDKSFSPRARMEAEIAEIKAEIAESDRKTQNRIEFIVEQQSKFSIDLEKLNETVGRLANATLSRFEESNAKHSDTDAKIAALVDAQMRTEETVKKTSEDLRNLIAVVDHYFTGGRNGK